MDSFLVNVQCHIPRHKVPHFKVKILKQWGRSGHTRMGYFISQYIKATAGGLGTYLLGIQYEDNLALTGFTLSRVIPVQAYKLLKCYFISLSYMSFHTFIV